MTLHDKVRYHLHQKVLAALDAEMEALFGPDAKPTDKELPDFLPALNRLIDACMERHSEHLPILLDHSDAAREKTRRDLIQSYLSVGTFDRDTIRVIEAMRRLECKLGSIPVDQLSAACKPALTDEEAMDVVVALVDRGEIKLDSAMNVEIVGAAANAVAGAYRKLEAAVA